MNLSNINLSTFDAIQKEVLSLESTITSRERCIEKQLQREFRSSRNDWTETYRKWDEWEDVEELEANIFTAKRKIDKIKKRRDKSKSNCHPGYCCSSKNRSKERRVAQMSTKERLKKMISFRKDVGNKCFKNEEFAQALLWYRKSLLYFEYSFPENKKEEMVLQKERLLCLLNIAACCLHVKDFRQCVEVCSEALEISKGNSVKALFRRAQAYRNIHKIENALRDLKQAKNLDKSSIHAEALRREENNLKEQIRVNEEIEKGFARRIMKSL